MNQSPSSESHAEALDGILADLADLEGPLLPILHAVQEELGYIPADALPRIAARLNISKAEVHGVMSFYHDFRAAPKGLRTLKICRAEACQSVGGNALADVARERLGIDWHGTTPNGRLTLEPVYCLGLCGCGPAVLMDDKVVGRVDSERLDRILSEALA